MSVGDIPDTGGAEPRCLYRLAVCIQNQEILCPNSMRSIVQRLLRLSTTNIADALDALSLKGATYGIRPLWEGAGKIAGRAVTVKIAAAGLTKARIIWA